jgi:hypothetical protein
MRLGARALGVFRLGGDLPAASNAGVQSLGNVRMPLFTQHIAYPGIEFSASMELDLYLYASVEVVGIPEDELLLLGAA